MSSLDLDVAAAVFNVLQETVDRSTMAPQPEMPAFESRETHIAIGIHYLAFSFFRVVLDLILYPDPQAFTLLRSSLLSRASVEALAHITNMTEVVSASCPREAFLQMIGSLAIDDPGHARRYVTELLTPITRDVLQALGGIPVRYVHMSCYSICSMLISTSGAL